MTPTQHTQTTVPHTHAQVGLLLQAPHLAGTHSGVTTTGHPVLKDPDVRARAYKTTPLNCYLAGNIRREYQQTINKTDSPNVLGTSQTQTHRTIRCRPRDVALDSCRRHDPADHQPRSPSAKSPEFSELFESLK